MTIQLNWKTPTKIVRWHNWAEQAVKKIVIFPDGVTEKQIRPAWWKPWANTLLYFPLENDAIDVVNSVSLTSSWTTNYTTVGWVKSAEFTKLNWLYNNNVAVLPQWDVAKTISMWTYIKGKNIGRYWFVMFWTNSSWATFWISWKENTDNICLSRWWSISSEYTPSQNTWINLVCTYDTTNKWRLYSNGNQTPVITWNTTAPTQWTSIYVWASIWNTETRQTMYWNLSNVIIENKVRTAQEVEDYYNQTKWNYWL